jgi:glycosyltransferase involved in cell wall biosynthesis
VTIGWIGTPVTQHYLKPLARVLRDLAQDSRFRVVLVGADQEPRKWFPCQVRQWKEGLEVDDILDFDIGIMPLSDTPWERGKCGYKLIQYMACGKPVVASPVGFNKTVVKHKHNGYWAITEEDWTSYLTLLSADFAARIEMGRLGREAVEKNFSTQVTGPRLSRMIMNLRAA